MPALVVPDALQVTVGGFVAGERWNNVYGIYNGSAFLMAQSVADEIEAAFAAMFTVWVPVMSTQWQYDEFIVRDIRTATSGSYEVIRGPMVGGESQNAMPPHVAVCASHKTALRGRSYRGRTYIAGLSEAANSSVGQVQADAALVIQNGYDTLRSNLASVTGGPFELAVISRVLGIATPVTDTGVDSEWDHQDRRKRRS